MSFLTEILSSAQEYDIQQLVNKSPEVGSLADVYKDEVNKYLDNVYVKFEEQRKNTTLLQQSKRLGSDLKHLIEIAEELTKRDLTTSSLNLSAIKVDLEKALAAYQVANQLLVVHEALQNTYYLRSQKCFIEAMKSLTSIESDLEAIPKEKRSKAFDKMVILIKSTEKSLVTEVSADISKNIIIDTINDKKHILKISKENESEIAKLLLVFELYSNRIEPLNQIIDFTWNKIFLPIVNSGASVEVHQDSEFNILSVTADKEVDSSYTVVFDNIKIALNFLYNHFNFPLQTYKSSLSYIGSDLQQNLSELLIKNCLEQTIPSTTEGLTKFKEVINETEGLQKELVKAEIFTEDFLPLVEYVKNVDTLFINKKCQEYNTKALVLMKKDLHDMVDVGDPHDENNPFGKLSENVFPKCAVSKSCIAILELVKELLQQCLTVNSLQLDRIIYTIQNIFYTYRDVVPEYHKKLLETIPQQVALFHNNCMYIAYKLTKWNEEYKTKLPSTLQISSVLFVDQPDLLRTTGSDIFSFYVKQQVEQIGSIMKDSGIDTIQAVEELPPTVEKAIRQCLRQQELLKTVWQKVLSYHVYNKAIGVIMNSLCMHLINAVLKVEDISSKLAEQLDDVFKVVVGRGPKIFTDPKEICLFVKSWNKFNELIFVLSASLIDIEDRWSNGKGPLALEFQAEDVRRLIRALFQNTSRRAQVLSRITT